MIKIKTLKKSPYKTAVALGCFDGLHLGHRAIINAAVKDSDIGLCPTVFTFNGLLPKNIANNNEKNILSIDEKTSLMNELGIQQIYEINFCDISFMPGEKFVKDILCNVLNAHKVYCGFNYSFGKGAACTAEDLKNICEKYKITAKIVPPVSYKNIPISSTRIKKSLKDGKIFDANKMLGRYYSLNYTVVKGKKLGTAMKTPTINQLLPNDLVLPKFGAYASIVTIEDKKFYGATNVGIRPTVGGKTPIAETWMPDYFGKELYQNKIKVELVDFIREEKKFENINALKNSIIETANMAKKILKGKLSI